MLEIGIPVCSLASLNVKNICFSFLLPESKTSFYLVKYFLCFPK